MKVRMAFQGNLGYAPDQVRGIRLGALLDAVNDAIVEWGEDAEVVLEQSNNGRGANFGQLYDPEVGQLFEADDDSEHDPDDCYDEDCEACN